MGMPGQASGGFTESSSALRLLYVQIRNSYAVLTPDGLTQTNPPQVATHVTTAPGFYGTVHGVLSGSVAFSRPDAGSNYCGGPVVVAGAVTASMAELTKPLGVFINTAVGNAFENQPGLASGRAPYVSGLGTFGNKLYETLLIGGTVGTVAVGDTLNYVPGCPLGASLNGYLMPLRTLNSAMGGVNATLDVTGATLEVTNGNAASTVIGILRMAPDSSDTEIVYDQRI